LYFVSEDNTLITKVIIHFGRVFPTGRKEVIFAIIAGVAKLFKRKNTTVPATEKNENMEEERSS